MKQQIIISSLLAAFVMLPMATEAKTVDILGITHDGTNAQIKAKLNLGDKVLKSVTAYSYNMTDGYAVTSRSCTVVKDGNDTYMSADVVYYPDADGYTYRVALTFDDNTEYLSEVVNLDLTESFMWLSDYTWTDSKTGWDGHIPVNDGEVDPSLKMTLDGVIYYKGVSNHADGFLEYDFSKITDAPSFTRFYTKYGVQDDRPEGDIYFSFLTDGTTQLDQLMYSKTNPARGTEPCVRDITFSMDNVKVLRINQKQYDNNNWGDHAHLAMARLYLPTDKTSGKASQEVTFTTPGGQLTGNVTLEASAGSGGKVFYSIVSGQQYATLSGNVLTPVWGEKGRVVVEATQYGNDEYYPATSYLYFDVDQQPRMEILGLYTPSVEDSNISSRAYLFVDTKDKNLDKLSATIYDNPRTLHNIGELDLLGSFDLSKGAQAVEIPIANYQDQVIKVQYSYIDSDDVVTMPYWHSEGAYDYISDLPVSAYTYANGWGNFPGANNTFDKKNDNVLEIGTGNISYGTYAKGFGFHATGHINVLPDALAPYSRVAMDIGPQKDGTANYSSQKLTYILTTGNMTLAEVVDALKTTYYRWDYPINNRQALKITGNQGSDGNGNDYVCVGAARLYYSQGVKTSQTLNWETDRRVVNNKSTTIDLVATSESGFPIFYYIVKGGEYASISNGKLHISSLPEGGAEIVIDAVQPGNDVWAATPVATCVFSLTHGLEVQRGEYVELNGSDVFDELIIHADKSSAGQVNVKKGLVDVKRLVLKYTFEPDEWVHIAFPADLDLDKISNLRELGYGYNAYGAPGYYIKELDAENYSRSNGVDGWILLDRPSVKANKGYIMSLSGMSDNNPVEVTFTIDNSSVDFTDVTHTLGLSLDFSDMQPSDKLISVTVTTDNPGVVSNNLTIEVSYNPSDLSSVPVNHKAALDNMRYIFVNGYKAIRLTLPDQSPAKVVFFDEKGKKIIKAVRYIAPNVIDLRDMKPGKYNMMVNYGPASKAYEIEL